jgi:hypothetical protein
MTSRSGKETSEPDQGSRQVVNSFNTMLPKQ